MFERDPRDPRYRERLAAGTIGSIVLHALLALLLVSVIASSSQEGATENVEGGTIVTVEQRVPAVTASRKEVAVAVPVPPHVTRVAPLQHAPITQPQTQRLPQNRHELAKQDRKAPPNPRPVPQQHVQPQPQPTENVYEVQPQEAAPAAPIPVPTIGPVAVSVRQPTAAPSPVPSARPVPSRSPKPPSPTSAPTERPSPAPSQRATAVPTAAAVARATARPQPSAAPAEHSSPSPAPHAGVPSPGPSAAAIVAKTAGTAPSPGPKGVGSPGPRPGTGAKTVPAPRRPVEIAPTPSPAPEPKPQKTRAPVPDINSRLRALLPSGPVHPQTKQFTPQISLRGSLRPTPPPEVLAETKYIYRSSGGGSSEGLVEMWVTAAHKSGPTTMCTGWLVRYPLNAVAYHAGDFAPPNGTQAAVGGASGRGTLPPIVEGIVTVACEGRLLEPYTKEQAP
jgi:hypothetical protein